jgi:hypothetical protein
MTYLLGNVGLEVYNICSCLCPLKFGCVVSIAAPNFVKTKPICFNFQRVHIHRSVKAYTQKTLWYKPKFCFRKEVCLKTESRNCWIHIKRKQGRPAEIRKEQFQSLELEEGKGSIVTLEVTVMVDFITLYKGRELKPPHFKTSTSISKYTSLNIHYMQRNMF